MKAFPYNPQSNEHHNGMDLRDYFASKAMQAIISNSDHNSIQVDEIDLWIGHYAYTVADAMLKERQK